MAVPLSIVSQYAMDLYYQNYKSNSDFFVLSDFIFHCGNTVTDFYLQQYQLQYAEIRQEKKDQVVAFSADFLGEQILKIKKEGGETFAIIEKPVMSFPFDKQNIGIQEIFVTKPSGCVDLERQTINAIWDLKYQPVNNRVFWWVDRDRIKFYTKGIYNVQEVRILYVPAANNEDAEVPDGIVKYVIDTTVLTMKQISQGVVVKKSVDGNQNKIIETEVNSTLLRR